MKRLVSLLTLSLLVGMAAAAFGEEIPHSQQAQLMVRILSFDRKLKASEQITIVVVYKAKNQTSENAKTAMSKSLTDIQHRREADPSSTEPKLVIAAVAFSDLAGLEGKIKGNKAAALYLCPGLESSAAEISKLTRAHGVRSFTANEIAVKGGLAIGMISRASKPTIIINLVAARAEGADFDPALIKVSEILK
jgi:hypothetical protein